MHRDDTSDSVRYAPIIELPKGRVRGTTLSVNTDGDVHQYLGIRYARCKRFERSTPIEPWSGVYDATIVRENMPQFGLDLSINDFYTPKYAEDSLLLNVWRPAASSKSAEKLAVMVFIFGGEFKTGSIFEMSYEGRYIAATGGVIVVTLNYRLGAAGWMVTNGGGGGGGGGGGDTNRGLYDMILALEWVQQNIDRFGGDKSRVTIFGNSAGSMSVSLLMLCARVSGLFRRAILQSGSAIGINHRNEMTHMSFELANYLGIAAAESDDDEDRLRTITSELRRCTIEEILDATEKLKLRFLPVYGDDLLPNRPIDAFKEGKFNTNIDLMYGVSMDEAHYFVGEIFPELGTDSITLDRAKCEEYVVKLMQKRGLKCGEQIARFYSELLPPKPTDTLLEHKRYIHAAYGAYFMLAPTVITAEQVARHARNRAGTQDRRHDVVSPKFYSFMMVAPPTLHLMRELLTRWHCACHGDELVFLFDIPRQTEQRERELSRRMIIAWTNFARSGYPESLGDVRWTEALPENGDFEDGATSYMALDYEPRMVHDAYRAVIPFWKSILFV